MTEFKKQLIVAGVLFVLFAIFLVFGQTVAQFILYLLGCWSVGQWIHIGSVYLVEKLWSEQ